MENEDKQAALARARRNAQLWAEREFGPTPKPEGAVKSKLKSRATKTKRKELVQKPNLRSESVRETIRDLTEQKKEIEKSIDLLKKRLNEILIEESNSEMNRKRKY